MRAPLFRLSIPIALFATVLTTASARQTTTPSLPSQPQPVQFTQLNWLDDAGFPLVPFSRVAVAALSFSANDQQLLQQQGGGYVNIVTDTGTGPRWSVENLYLVYPDVNYIVASNPTVQFDSGIQEGFPVGTIGWSMAITHQPLASPPNQLLVYSQVQHKDYAVGGRNKGGSGSLDLERSIGLFVGCHAADCAPHGFIAMTPAPAALAIGAVDEGKMGCVPGGIARSLKYLFGSGALKDIDVQQIYDELYRRLGTNPTTGTNDAAIKTAKRDYAKAHGLDVQTNLHNFKDGARIGSEGINAGADVEIQIKWPNGQGHVAMVTSIVSLGKDKGYEIKYVDDPTQGDGKKENEEHVITVDKDGKITSGGAGKVEGFIVETKTK